LRQIVKAQFSGNGELSYGIVAQDVYAGFKLAAARWLEAGFLLAEVSRGLEVSPNVLHRWVREFRQVPGNAIPGQGQRRWSEGRVAELERKIGQLAMEIVRRGGLRACLERIEEQRMLQRHRLEVRGLPESRRRNERRPASRP